MQDHIRSDLAKAVAQVRVARIIGMQLTEAVCTGTGFMVAATLALTCWHVVEAGLARYLRFPPSTQVDLDDQLASVLFRFAYEKFDEGTEYKIVKLEYLNAKLDYAILRLKDDRTEYPLASRGYLSLELDANAPLTQASQLMIIPAPQRVAEEAS